MRRFFCSARASEDFSEEHYANFLSDGQAKQGIDVSCLLSACRLQRLQKTRLPRICSEECSPRVCARRRRCCLTVLAFWIVAASIEKGSVRISPRIVPRSARMKLYVCVVVVMQGRFMSKLDGLQHV